MACLCQFNANTTKPTGPYRITYHAMFDVMETLKFLHEFIACQQYIVMPCHKFDDCSYHAYQN